MADKTRYAHHIILIIISSRRGIISIAIGGRGRGGTNEVTMHIVIIVVFRISTMIVVAKGIIIIVDFGLIGINDGVIVIIGVAFGCSIKIRFVSGRGRGSVIIRSRMKIKMMIVAFEIIIDIVFGIVIGVVVVVNFKSPISGVRGVDTAVGTVIVK